MLVGMEWQANKMDKESIEKKFGIIIPDTSATPRDVSFKYENCFNKNIELTSVSQIFCFNHFPLQDFNDFKTNDFDYYSIPLLEERKILPFADDGGGYFICLDYRYSNSNPKIVLWIRDNPEAHDLTLIADSFDEFINSLKSEDELE
jgi:hypothetical protein